MVNPLLLVAAGSALLFACSSIEMTSPDAGNSVEPTIDAQVAPTDCQSSSECSGMTPVCDPVELVCEACSDSGDCSVSSDGDQCSDSGACVECTSDTHCTEPSASVCDAGEFCRGCAENSECESGACDIPMGVCVATADIVFVDGAGGNDAGTCTKAQPCRSVSFAMSQVSGARHTMVLTPGTYAERLESPGGLPLFRIIGNGAVLDGDSLNPNSAPSMLRAGFSSHMVVEDLEVRNAPDLGIACRGEEPFTGKGRLSLRNVSVMDTAGIGISNENPCLGLFENVLVQGTEDSGISWVDGDLTINRSELNGNRSTALYTNNSKMLLQNTLIIGNGSSSYNRILSHYGNSNQPIVIRYNTIVSNAPGCVPTVQYATTNQPVLFHSNIVHGNDVQCGQDVDPHADSPPVNNILEDQNSGPLPSGNFIGDPGFADFSNGDYSLRQDSIGVDSGAPGEAPMFDKLGNPRPLGAGPDVGAYESF